MAAETYSRPRQERFMLVPEVTFKTGVTFVGTDVVPIQSAATLTHDRPESEVMVRKDTVGVAEFIRDQKYTTTWSIPDDTEFKPSGVAGSEPDLAMILKAWFGSQIEGNDTDTTAAYASNSTTLFKATTVADFTVGDVLRFAGNVTTAIAGECAFVTGISTDYVTIAPALSTTISAAGGDTVNIGYAWAPVQDNDESLTAYHDLLHTVVGASGCQVNTINFSVGNAGRATLGASGDGCGTYTVTGTTLVAGGGIDNAVTAVTVTTGDGDKFLIDSNVPMYLTIEAEGANTEETVEVTAVSGDVLTIDRAEKGTGASAHAAGAVIKPYRPSATLVGSPITGLVGDFEIDGSAFGLQEFSFSGDNGHVMLANNIGETVSEGFQRSGNNPRKVNITLTAKFKKETLLKHGGIIDEDTFAVWLKLGTTAYSIVCLYFPIVRFKIPPFDPSGDPIATLTLEGVAMESSGNDEIYMGVI